MYISVQYIIFRSVITHAKALSHMLQCFIDMFGIHCWYFKIYELHKYTCYIHCKHAHYVTCDNFYNLIDAFSDKFTHCKYLLYAYLQTYIHERFYMFVCVCVRVRL